MVWRLSSILVFYNIFPVSGSQEMLSLIMIPTVRCANNKMLKKDQIGIVGSQIS